MKSCLVVKSLFGASRVLMLGLLTLMIMSCGGGGGSPGTTSGTSGGDTSTTTALYTTAQATIIIAPGDAPTFTVGGGTAPYTATSSNSAVATVIITGNALTITGVAGPTAIIQVRDAKGALVTINVNVGSVNALFTTAPSAVTLASGAVSTYSIGGGTGPYSASSSNVGIATASASGTTLTITGIAVGSANISVFDSMGASVVVTLTVSTVSSTPMRLIPSSATANVGDVLNFIVTGGSPGYTITVNNPSIAKISPTTVSTSGGSFMATLLNVGTTTVAIVDALGQTATFTLTVASASPSLRLSPSALLVGEDYDTAIVLSIYGGTAPYTAFTSDLGLSGVSITGTAAAPTLTVATGTQGSRCINPVSSSGTYIMSGTYDVTLTVKDSLGASATSVLTIKDNGKGLTGTGC